MSCKFVFVTGGVVSSVGKGLTVASIASLLQSAGLRIAVRKFDPYLNVDPGTMSPVQHGEVFVTDDGAETDLDLGYYERFTDIKATSGDSVTAGKIYSELLQKEREGFYLGQTVQVIPHVTDLIKKFIYKNSDALDVILCEIGGTVGDIEGQPFFEAARQVGYEVGRENVLYVHVTLIPYLFSSDEVKTKPTQHSVKSLNSIGIQPGIIFCRTQKSISAEDKKKISLFCNIDLQNVIEVKDLDNIYDLPVVYKKQNLDKTIFNLLDIGGKNADVAAWNKVSAVVSNARNSNTVISVVIVGKYTGFYDIYKSVVESIQHACFAKGLNPKITILDAKDFKVSELQHADCVLIPGGFGSSGIEGKISAIQYARINKIPTLGICLGLQLMVIEFARNVLKLEDPNSTEFDRSCKNKVVALLEEWKDASGLKKGNSDQKGGTMRLGAYDCSLNKGSLVSEVYGCDLISERHRHRYEVNPIYKDEFKKQGLEFSGHCKANKELPEVVELKNHPWFLGVQFHPEFKSRIFKPHPLFLGLAEAALQSKDTKQARTLGEKAAL